MSTERSLFDIPIVFFRIGWMNRYRGITEDDSITGGGAYVEERGYGHEILNFQPFEGMVYGHVMPGKGAGTDEFAKIKLGRIKKDCKEDSLSYVLVFWVATSPDGGANIIGWYNNATVFRLHQDSPHGSNRQYNGNTIGYFTSATEKEAVWLPIDERVFPIPQGGKGNFGQSNMWYVDVQNNPIHKKLRKDVLQYVKDRSISDEGRPRPPRQHDVLLRQLVEKIAIETTTAYYRKLYYEVRSVEKDNVGWDLEAIHGNRMLRLEVKGLSGSEIAVELTPNEFAKMKENRISFRLCIVTNALTKPNLTIFQFNSESGRWESDDDGRPLNVNEVVSARCTASRLEVK